MVSPKRLSRHREPRAEVPMIAHLNVRLIQDWLVKIGLSLIFIFQAINYEALATANYEALATADACAVTLKTPDGFLNLREGPGTEYEIVSKLYPGDNISVDSGMCDNINGQSICTDGSWTRIRDEIATNDGIKMVTRGWVATKYIRTTDCPSGHGPLFIGRWHWNGQETCLKNYDSPDVAIAITANDLGFYETRCNIRSVRKRSDKFYRLRLACRGEMGEMRSGEHIMSMLPKSKISEELLLLIDPSHGQIRTYKRCS